VELADLRAEAHTSTWRGPQPLVISARAHAGQARLRAEGYLQGLTADAPPAVSVALQARRFGGAIARLGLPRLREVDSLLLARLEGPLSDPHLLARLSGVGWDAGWGGARLMGALFDYRDRLVRVHSALVNGWSGQVQGSGWLALHHRAWGVDARLISLRPPRELRNRVEGLDAEVSGLLHTLGSLSFPPRSHTYFHVTANRRSGDSPLPRAIRVMGALRTTPQRLSIHRLLGYSPLGSLDTTGEVLLAGPGPRRLDLRLGVWTRKLRRHLQLRGHRCLVDGVYLRGRLHGELLSPRFDGRLTLLDFRPVRGRGVTLVRIPVLHSPVTLEGGLLHAPDLSHPRYGRYLGGSLQLSLYDGDLHNLHTPRLWFDWGLRR
jgi:hypothetical protein